MQIENVINSEYLDDNQNKRIECPDCSQNRKKKNQKTLSLTRDGDNILYQCWHCQLSGVVDMNKKVMPVKTAKVPANPIPISVAKTTTLIPQKKSEIKMLSDRGISTDTAEKYGVMFDKRGFNGAGYQDAIGFPYFHEGKPYAVKWRTVEGKNFTQEGSARTLFGLESLNIKDLIVICEGEFDALALYEAGIDCAVSVPNGAVMKVSNNKVSPQEDKKFAYIWNASDQLDKIEKIVLCCDKDSSGSALTEELSRRIGKNKVWIANLPEGCKDANQTLLEHGKEVLVECIANAEPYPLSALYNSTHYENSVIDLYDKGFMSGASTGFKNVDELFTVAGGQLSVVTGIPSSGKSEFIDMIMMNLAKKEGWKFAVCSFENPPDFHIAKMVEKYVDKPFFSGATKRMNEDERDNALRFIEEHFMFIDYTNGESATIDSILEKSIGAVRQMGCRGLVIDPYNYIEMDKSTSETDSISNMLTKVSQFAKAHDIHVFFISHPTKMYPDTNGKIPVPTGYSISGSASWFAKADMGITVQRGEATDVDIHVWKCRFKWIGKQGIARLEYYCPTGVYSEQTIDDVDNYDWTF